MTKSLCIDDFPWKNHFDRQASIAMFDYQRVAMWLHRNMASHFTTDFIRATGLFFRFTVIFGHKNWEVLWGQNYPGNKGAHGPGALKSPSWTVDACVCVYVIIGCTESSALMSNHGPPSHQKTYPVGLKLQIHFLHPAFFKTYLRKNQSK